MEELTDTNDTNISHGRNIERQTTYEENSFGSVCNSWSDDSESETIKSPLVSPFDCNICLDGVTQPVVTRCGHLYCWPCLYRWLDPGMLPEEKEALMATNRTEQSSTNQRPVFSPGAVDKTRRCCPVCKAESSVTEIIPIYVRNNNDNTASSAMTPTRSNRSCRKKRGKRKAGAVTSEESKEEGGDIPVPSRPLPPPPQPNAFTEILNQRLNSSNNPPHQHILPPQHRNNNLDPSLQQSLFSALLGMQNQPFNSDTAMLSPEDATSEFLSRLLLVLGSFVVLCLLIF